MTRDEIDELFEAATRSTGGGREYLTFGALDPAMDPVTWFRDCMAKREETRIYCVSADDPGDAEGRAAYLIVAITGNGPQAEDNARFFSVAAKGIADLVNERLRMRERIERLERLLAQVHEQRQGQL